jgi:hypothetical protein
VGLTAKENLLRVIHHNNPAWVPNGMEAVVYIEAPLVERPVKAGLDAFGVRWSMDDGGTYPAHGGHTVSDLASWRDQVVFPDIEQLDWQAVVEQAKTIDRRLYLVGGFFQVGIFERSYLLLGMEEALMAYLTAPALMEELAAAIADHKIRLIERMHELIGLDIIRYTDDWGTQHQLFMPPSARRQVIRPHTERIYRATKKHGILVQQHSCGKIEEVVGDMVEMGADIWDPCQPCNDLAKLKAQYGDILAFCGGIDSQGVLNRPGVTPEEVRAEVRVRIDQLAAGGGYIARPSHMVAFDPSVIQAMKEEIADYGHRYYRRQAPCT